MAIEFNGIQVDHSCDKYHHVRTYLTGLIVLFVVVVIQNAVIVHYSMKGTIVNDAPRRRVPELLHVRGGIMMLEWIWDIVGMCYLYVGPRCHKLCLSKRSYTNQSLQIIRSG